MDSCGSQKTARMRSNQFVVKHSCLFVRTYSAEQQEREGEEERERAQD